MAPHRAGRGLATYAAAVALAAYLGVVGLAVGFLPGTDELRPRLPFHSTLFGAVALLCVVALPTTVTAVLAWRRDPRAPQASLLAGLLLGGWIVVEVLVVRALSPLQPICVVLSLGLVIRGLVPSSSTAPAVVDGRRRASVSPRGGSSAP